MGLVLRISLAVSAIALIPSLVSAAQQDAVTSPAKGVICDRFFCADKFGISNGLTTQYLGQAASDKLTYLGDFNRTAFTLANGIFCDTNELRCYEDRSFGPNGKHSPVSLKYTGMLFGGTSLLKKR